MEELAGLAFAIVFLGAVVTGAVIFRNYARKKLVESSSVPTLGLHTEEAIRHKTEEYYRLSQRSVRVFEHLLADRMNCVLPLDDEQTIKEIIQDFYK